jgi:hypothetical protein
MLGKHSTTELYSKPVIFFFIFNCGISQAYTKAQRIV